MIGAFDIQLTQKLAKEYKRANKKRKGEMLTEYCLLTEVSRNTSSKRFCKEIRDVYPRVLPKTTIRPNISNVPLSPFVLPRSSSSPVSPRRRR